MYYSIEKRRIIVEIYIFCHKNMTESRREFIRRFPDEAPPTKITFKQIYNKFIANNSLDNSRRRKNKTVLTEERELEILLKFIEEPRRSMLSVAKELNISQSSVMKVMKKYNYKSYHILPVQHLNENDFRSRRLFCEEMINRINENENFLENIFWTDESSFSTSGIFNRKNTHHWATQNPHAVAQVKKQGRRTVNCWCGIHKSKIIGPFFIGERLTGQTYLNILQTNVEDYLDELPLLDILRVCWQQDDAPPHSSREVTDFLNDKYRLWIGKNGPIRWPARSPDLNPLDYFLWGTLKEKIYSEPVENIEQLKNEIEENVNLLNLDVALFQKIRSNFIKRCLKCIELNGGYVENVM